MNKNPRNLAKGLGEAVAKRTILRTKKDGNLEDWGDVARRVALGNASLLKNKLIAKPSNDDIIKKEQNLLEKHIANASLLMSGRHLQHGDKTQLWRNQEVFTNCSTSSSSFLLFYLLMNGSGVGRAYDDDLCLIDWAKNMPEIRVVLDESHKDFDFKSMEGKKDAAKKYYHGTWYVVPDDREGWAKAVEILENMTYNEKKNDMLVLDFSEVRPSGSPINGMQGRPASGPAPLMESFKSISTLKNSRMKPWESTMWVDHYLAECVLVGGARRSARIATKVWSDPDIKDFIEIKKGGFLWSANNSVAADDEFWNQDTYKKQEILNDVLKSSYHDGTGEPGFINQHMLVQKDDGMEIFDDGDFAGSNKYKITWANDYLRDLAGRVKNKKYTQITNPCGEITLHVLGGYCVIADVVPYYAEDDDDAEEAFRVATRALMRVNTMDCLYKKEVDRTNRIGVGMTGIHEYAWDRFGYNWHDLVDEDKSMDFWLMLSRFKRAVDDEAEKYSKILGVNVPHTNTTIKPAGCQRSDTLITTKKGILSLSEIGDIDGDKWQDHSVDVSTPDGLRTSKKFYVNGEAKTKLITLNSGIQLEGTLDHKYRVLSNGKLFWKTASHILPGDKLPYAIGGYDGDEYQKLKKVQFTTSKHAVHQKHIIQPGFVGEDLAWLLGLYFGDGSNHKRSIRIHGDVTKKIDLLKAQSIIQEIFGITAKINEPNREGNRLELNINSNQIVAWLDANNILKQKSPQIEIPLCIRKSPKSVIEAFIDGYYTADGSFALPHTPTACTTSEVFARQLVVVLRSIGRDSKIRLMPPTSSSKGNRMRYWVSERKGRKSLKRYISKDLRDDWAHLDNLNLNSYSVDTVIDVKDSVCQTYDIEVDQNHTYHANSYISHNTTSKLFALSEGAHLPAMKEYIRWVQFRNDDPLVAEYKKKGYPTKELITYKGSTVVGFPTQPEICKLGMGDRLVVAGDATPDEQYQWLRLLEKYWIHGVENIVLEEDEGLIGSCYAPLQTNTGNQVSYTLKYKPDRVSFEEYSFSVGKNQPTIRCASVMPQIDTTAYEYTPEESVSNDKFAEIVDAIKDEMTEDINLEHLKCESGACPI